VLLALDEAADCYIFDDFDKSISVTLDEIHIKINFRICLLSVWSPGDESDDGMAAMAQHLLELMARRLGLTWTGILAQFNRVYGGGSDSKIEEFERQRVGKTSVDMMVRNSASACDVRSLS
jgi:hypothetical protein